MDPLHRNITSAPKTTEPESVRKARERLEKSQLDSHAGPAPETFSKSAAEAHISPELKARMAAEEAPKPPPTLEAGGGQVTKGGDFLDWEQLVPGLRKADPSTYDPSQPMPEELKQQLPFSPEGIAAALRKNGDQVVVGGPQPLTVDPVIRPTMRVEKSTRGDLVGKLTDAIDNLAAFMSEEKKKKAPLFGKQGPTKAPAGNKPQVRIGSAQDVTSSRTTPSGGSITTSQNFRGTGRTAEMEIGRPTIERSLDAFDDLLALVKSDAVAERVQSTPAHIASTNIGGQLAGGGTRVRTRGVSSKPPKGDARVTGAMSGKMRAKMKRKSKKDEARAHVYSFLAKMKGGKGGIIEGAGVVANTDAVPAAKMGDGAGVVAPTDVIKRSLNGQLVMDMRKGGLYSFADHGNDPRQALPASMLPEYLAAFVEEAYEHEKRECEHRKVAPMANEEHCDFWAKRVMSELVQYMRKNKDLHRAAKGKTYKHIADILRTRGLATPESKATTLTDRDSMAAMGAVVDGHSAEVMAFSQARRGHFQEPLDKAAGMALSSHRGFTPAAIIDDKADPFALAAQAGHAKMAAMVKSLTKAASGMASHACPLHGHGDLTKTQNLSNPNAKCVC